MKKKQKTFQMTATREPFEEVEILGPFGIRSVCYPGFLRHTGIRLRYGKPVTLTVSVRKEKKGRKDGR